MPPISISISADLKTKLDAHIASLQSALPVGTKINRNSWIVDLIRRALSATPTAQLNNTQDAK